jgi:Na+-driven multidrug efflux pump
MGVWRVVALGTVRFGSPVVQPVISIVALAVNCMLNVVLIPHIGAVGAGLASSASYALAAALTIGWLTVRGDVAWLDLVPRRRDLAELRRIPAMVLRRS